MQMQTILRAIYPPQCASCSAVVEEDFALCGSCWREMHFITGLSCFLCGAPLLGDGDETVRCDDCMHIARPWRSGSAAILYQGKGRAMALKLKHADQTQLSRVAGKWMADKLTKLDPDTCVVPVPLHWGRFFKRRYNQAALLGREVAVRHDLEFVPDALRRTKATHSLDKRSREDRFSILAGSITAHPKQGASLSDRPVLLVDDVMTTGATLATCTDACFAAGAREVDVITLARVAKAA